jgi:hypothetical protein
MDISAPVSLEQFMKVFSNWPEDSISQRTDRVGLGSSWGIREIGTFQVIRRPPTEETPLFLKDYFADFIRASQSRLEVDEPWTNPGSRRSIASFLSALSQVMEEPITADSDRLMRERVQSQLVDLRSDPNLPESGSSNSQETPPPFGSSPPE